MGHMWNGKCLVERIFDKSEGSHQMLIITINTSDDILILISISIKFNKSYIVAIREQIGTGYPYEFLNVRELENMREELGVCKHQLSHRQGQNKYTPFFT